MDAFRRLTLLVLVTGFVLAAGVQAQVDLALFTPVSGSISAGDSETWTFNAADGAMLSFVVEATSGDLDPVLTIASSSGSFTITNDDFAYPDSRDALIEGMTVPSTGSYTATVSGFDDTSGDYQLTMLAGFSDLVYHEDFEDETRWQAINDDAGIIFGDNRMALVVSGEQPRAVMAYERDTAQDSYTVRVHIPEITGPSDWRVGIAARYQDDGSYYLYALNHRGEWRFSLNTDDGEQIIRDWSTHPAIAPGAIEFDLSLMVNNTVFEFFYNDQLIGRLNDSSLTEAGQIGLVAETSPTQSNEVIARFGDLTVTAPHGDLVPEQLISGDSTASIQALQRHRLIPTTGEIGLVIPESFITFNRPGVNTLTLGGSQTFSRFAIGTTVTAEVSLPDAPAGCGLMLRATDENDYLLAYLDQTGAAGLSRRADDTFDPGIYREGLELDSGSHRLLVVAGETQLLYYVDGTLIGVLEAGDEAGSIGNAVVNFEPVTTSCQFNDTWVWAWD